VRRCGALLAWTALLICLACSSIKNKKVTEENKDKILSEVQTSKDLTEEERRLLAAYAIRQSTGNILDGGKPGLPTGKTVGEMIAEQRQWAAQEKTEEDKQKQLAAAVSAKQAELRNVIGVALYLLTTHEGDEDLTSEVEVGYAYENRSTKDVRAFEGEVAFKDILGNDLGQVSLKVLTPLKAGQKASVIERHSLSYLGNLGDLRGKKLEDVKIEWRPKNILFADGTSAEDGSIKD
jgi:hypothetical protein